MNPAHLHLLVNHLPIMGTLFGILVLIGGILLKNPIVRQTALALFVLSACLAVPAYFSGEEAEEMIENLSGVNASALDKHEDFAPVFVGLISLLGLVSLLGLFWDIRKTGRMGPVIVIVLLLAFVTMGAAWQAGLTGGEIRHPEISAVSPGNQMPSGEDDD